MTALLVLILRIALAIALYAFLGRILLTLWQELKQQGEFLSSQKKAGDPYSCHHGKWSGYSASFCAIRSDDWARSQL